MDQLIDQLSYLKLNQSLAKTYNTDDLEPFDGMDGLMEILRRLPIDGNMKELDMNTYEMIINLVHEEVG